MPKLTFFTADHSQNIHKKYLNALKEYGYLFWMRTALFPLPSYDLFSMVKLAL